MRPCGRLIKQHVETMDYEDALNIVAEERNMPSWELLMAAYEGLLPYIGTDKTNELVRTGYERAAEIFVVWYVRADREAILRNAPGQTIMLSKEIRTEEITPILNASFIRKMPVPFNV